MSTLSNDPRTLSHEAYVYLYPLVTMEITRRQSINKDAATHPPFGPPNQFHHLRAFPAAEFRAVVRPNFDTLYSSAWIDLSDGPVVVSTADTQDRYFMLPMLDMWTDVFANPGKRTTGTSAESFVLVPPGWSGDVPSGTRIDAPTAWVWVIGRTQTNGPADYAAVNAVQDGFGITAARRREFAVDPDQDITTEALRLVNGLSAVDFFTLACETMMQNPPHSTDFSILNRIAQIGIVPGQPFDPGAAEAGELQAGAADGLQAIHDAVTHVGQPHNGWAVIAQTIGVYGNAYVRRAAVALAGLGANPSEDAIYPLLLFGADGKPTTGERELRDPLRCRQAAAGVCVLVDHHVRRRGLPGAERARPVRDRRSRRADVQHRRLARHLSAAPRTPEPIASRTGCHRPRPDTRASPCGSMRPGPRRWTAAGLRRR